MRNKRVVIYGGTRLDSRVATFVSRLAYALLTANDSIVLATGGFKRSLDSPPTVTSTDVAALRGAETFASELKVPLESCLETWLPEPSKDRIDEGVERFSAGKHEVLPGLSAQARRLRLVQMADALVTVSGHVRTALVLEMAVAITRPALPLPFTGGDSRDHWTGNRSYYVARLGITADQASRWETLDLDSAGEASLQASVNDIVATVSRVIRRNCLVLMPFGADLLDYYQKLKDVIDGEGFHAVRLDRDLYAGDVRDSIGRLLRESDAVVADVTDRSPNVMYEIGLAHAFGREPLLVFRGASAALETKLPFYLRPQRVVWGNNEGEILESVRAFLKAPRTSL